MKRVFYNKYGTTTGIRVKHGSLRKLTNLLQFGTTNKFVYIPKKK